MGLVAAVAVFSIAVNLLNLTGPLFMMQVYDRVLGSGSVPTLAALFGLVAFLFAMMGLIDLARVRVMSRVAMRFQDRLESRVFQAALAEGAVTGQATAAQGGEQRERIGMALEPRAASRQQQQRPVAGQFGMRHRQQRTRRTIHRRPPR